VLPSTLEVSVAKFDVVPDQLTKLAENRRFAAELARLAWPRLLDTGCVVTKADRDPDAVLLDEWDEDYQRHLGMWAGNNIAQVRTLLEGLANELTELMDDLTPGSAGRPPSD
jgi:hypothetical protein